MASPQKENGFTPIAHEILEHLMCVRMSGAEWQYAVCIFRKTYGFQKKEDWVTNTQVMEMTGLCKERVSEAKTRLIKRNIVTENRNKISFQKDWEKWVELRKNVSNSYGKTYRELRKSVHTIDTITIDNKLASKDAKSSMKKNSFRYQENKHQDFEEVIDLDTGEEVPDPEDEVKKKVTALLEWAETLRGKKFVDAPTQRKFIHSLRTLKISPTDIKNTYRELLQSDYWQNQDRLPDFKTVYSSLKNKKHGPND